MNGASASRSQTRMACSWTFAITSSQESDQTRRVAMLNTLLRDLTGSFTLAFLLEAACLAIFLGTFEELHASLLCPRTSASRLLTLSRTHSPPARNAAPNMKPRMWGIQS
jgi:hypothetical protein